jgi:hypothetical protein
MKTVVSTLFVIITLLITLSCQPEIVRPYEPGEAIAMVVTPIDEDINPELVFRGEVEDHVYRIPLTRKQNFVLYDKANFGERVFIEIKADVNQPFLLEVHQVGPDTSFVITPGETIAYLVKDR